jgi:hypothetical protein
MQVAYPTGKTLPTDRHGQANEVFLLMLECEEHLNVLLF